MACHGRVWIKKIKITVPPETMGKIKSDDKCRWNLWWTDFRFLTMATNCFRKSLLKVTEIIWKIGKKSISECHTRLENKMEGACGTAMEGCLVAF